MGRPRSLRDYVVAAALLVGLLPLGLVGALGVLESRLAIRHFEAVLAADDRQTMAGAQFYLDAVLETARFRCERWARSAAFRQFQPGAQQDLQAYLEVFPRASFILALDVQDKPFAFVAQDRFLKAKDVVRVLPVLPTHGEARVFFTRLFRMPRGEPVVAVVYDYPEGFIVYGLDLTEYGDALAEATRGLASGIVYVVGPQGQIILETEPLQDLVGKDIRGLPFVQRLLAGETGTVRLPPGTPYFSSTVVTYAPVPGTGWGLLVATPVETLEAPIIDLYMQAIAVLLLSMLGVVAIAAFGSRLVGRFLDEHIARLADFAKGHWAAGESNAGIREFQEVNHHFKELAERIQRDADERLAQLAAAQAALVRSERMAAMGQLAAVLAHEIKNRFNVIQLGSQSLGELVREGAKPEEIKLLTDSISQAVKRGNDLMMSLLRFARPTSSHAQPYQMNDTVEKAMSVVRRSNVVIHEDFQPDLPPILGNPGEMEQVLVNLLLNSLQAMPEGGVIWVETRQEGGEVRVVIRDSGPGMGTESLEKIFEPFYTTKADGTGLGMAIAKQIVESQGGQIAVDSVLGRGTTVQISLPMPQDSGGSTPISSNA